MTPGRWTSVNTVAAKGTGASTPMGMVHHCAVMYPVCTGEEGLRSRSRTRAQRRLIERAAEVRRSSIIASERFWRVDRGRLAHEWECGAQLF